VAPLAVPGLPPEPFTPGGARPCRKSARG